MPWRSLSFIVMTLLTITPAFAETAGLRQVSDSGRVSPRAVDLERRITVNVDRIRLDEALKAIARAADVPISYGSRVVPVNRIVSYNNSAVPLRDVLEVLLKGTGIEPRVMGDQLVLVKASSLVSEKLPVSTIVGRVTEAQSGTGVAGAEVFLEGTKWRTTSDTTGRYWLVDVDSGTYTLTVRRLGYAKLSRRVTVLLNRTDTVDVALRQVVTRLNELVTTATGQQRRLDIANDVTTIHADSVMQAAPVRSVTDLLATRVPGLTAQRTSGAPGDPSRLRVRGVGSPLRNNDPIVIVDGMRVYAEQSAARSANLADATYAAPSPLDYIDPNSIETIEVFKGPSAATLYGQDAANGVIVITTKKGRAGPTRWTANFEQGWTNITGRFSDLLLSWGHRIGTDQVVACPAIGFTGVNACVPDSVVSFQMLNNPALTVIDRGHRTSLSLTTSGGSGALTYSVTGSYQTELGLPKLPDYEVARYQDRFELSPPEWMRRPQRLTQWSVATRIGARLGATADLDLSINLSRLTQQGSSLAGQLGQLMTIFVDSASGTYYTSNGFDGLSGPNSVSAGLLSGYYQQVTATPTQFTNGLTFTWRPQRWLNLSAVAGLNLIHRSDELFQPNLAGLSTGISRLGGGTSLTGTVKLAGSAVTPIGRGFQLRFAMGAEYTGESIKDHRLSTSNLPAGTSELGTVITSVSRNVEDDVTFGWYVAPSIGNQRFNFESGLRLDGGRNFGGSVRGLSVPRLPKLGFSYLVSDEPWFPFKDAVQSLRVRVAYGKATRQPGPTDWLRLYGAPSSTFVGGQFVDAAGLNTIGNTRLKPERSTEVEGGFDLDLFDSRVSMTISGYQKTTDDAILEQPLPPSVYGNSQVFVNIGQVRNTGLDATARLELLRSQPLTWETQLTLSHNRNVVVKLGPGVEPYYASNEFAGGGLRVAAGYPLFGRWSIPILGYADANGDGVLDRGTEVLVGDTAVYVGPSEPNYTARLGSSVRLWGGMVTLNAGFAYDDGLTQKNEVAEMLGPFSRAQNDPTASLAEQAATIYGRLGAVRTDYNWIQVVNTFRFNDLAVTFQAPRSMARRLGAQALRIAVQGGNLGVWTNYSGLDPNVNANVTGNGLTDTGILPQPRTWQVRVNLEY